MAFDPVNLGTGNNTGDGEGLRDGGVKINAMFQELYNSRLEKRIVVNQSNVSTTLGGAIDSTAEYFIDGVLDLTGVSIEVPSTGIYIRGYNFDISQLVCSDDTYTMFTSPVGGSGNILFDDIGIEVSGINSKVYDLTGDTGFEAIELNKVNYNNCTSLGEINTYRQGLEIGTGRFGGQPSLILTGVWNGFRITTSIARNIDNAMTEPIFKAGLGFTLSGRFLTDINIDLGTTAPLADFAPSNFTGSDKLEIEKALISRGGVFNPMDATILPNIESTDKESLFIDNIGITNTHKGGKLNITAETVTNIISSGAYVDLDGTWTSSDLDHFDDPVNGQLRHLDSTPKAYKLKSAIVLSGDANDECGVRVVVFRDSGSVDEVQCTQLRLIDNLQGGRDVAYFNIDCRFDLYENDIVRLQVANITDTSDVTAELNSYFLIEAR